MLAIGLKCSLMVMYLSTFRSTGQLWQMGFTFSRLSLAAQKCACGEIARVSRAVMSFPLLPSRADHNFCIQIIIKKRTKARIFHDISVMFFFLQRDMCRVRGYNSHTHLVGSPQTALLLTLVPYTSLDTPQIALGYLEKYLLCFINSLRGTAKCNMTALSNLDNTLWAAGL